MSMVSGRNLALWPAWAAAAAVLLATMANAPVQASALQVSPVRVEFEPSEKAQAVYLMNNGKEPLDAQIRIQRWTQQQGEDVLAASDDLVASPAIVKVAPGQRQVVRLVRREPTAPSGEQSYRVLIDELPTRQAPKHSGITVLMRYSIPIFITSSSAPKVDDDKPPAQETDLSTIHAQLVSQGAGKTELRVSNKGPTHIRISHLDIGLAEGKRSIVTAGLLGYVLPGQEMSWPVNVPYPLPAGQTLKARFNDDRETHPVPLDVAAR
ncbi:fimbrial biogenesis chaperone [Luteibacter jiangsuensis]|jgi:fimbrial chaperone protein